VSTNLPLWGLEEEKRLLVIAPLCGILNGDVASFVGVNFGLNLVSPCLLEFFVSNSPYNLFFIPIYHLIAIQLISVVAGGS
jgi:hypothetical protein